MELDTLIDEPEARPRYVIGIDLGTTNSAVAYVDLQTGGGDGGRPARVFAVPQLVAPGEVASRDMLPSFLYLPGAHELPPGSAALPWDEQRRYLVGEAALEQGARVPGRLVASAKSWLSHAAVDRTAPILPWGAAAEVAKVSPVEASRRYLEHIREAWDTTMAAGQEADSLAHQSIVLTVPASFDEVARELTMRAAEQAGLGHAVLLEEPLAAFYAWLAEHEGVWQAQLREGQLILVVDVGGGTSDFTIVGVRRGEAGLRFDRLAVGEHLMLGGDNMDLLLGRFVETRLMGQPGKLDTQRWQRLVYACRRAKETLLSDADAPEAVDITVLGTSGQVIGGALTGKLHRDDVLRLLVDGFFPAAPLDTVPATRRSGLTELGLPFVADAAITHHLAAFWRRFETLLRQETGREALYPDWLLFNGGTLVPRPIRERLTQTVQQWFAPVAPAAWQPRELPNPQPELAVALGAAYYGVVRQGHGVRVGSGSPRAFYVAVDTVAATPAAETYPAVCLVPRGTEEGFRTQLDRPSFVALTNQAVSFQMWTSSTRLGDRLGDIVQLVPDEITALPPIRSVLRYGRGVVDSIPVRLEVRLTEVGTLELWCRAQDSDHRWRLQFDLRREAAAGPAAPPQPTVDEAEIEQAQTTIRSTFNRDAPPEHTPAALRSALERILGLARDKWPTQTIRRLAETLFECQAGRARSAEHEIRWLNLLGFCLRPGYGDIGDEVLIQQAWKLYLQGLSFPKEPQCRSEWWVLWRRIAGGLSSGRQQHIYAQIWPYLEGAKSSKQKPNPMFPKSLRPGEDLEIWMTLASFEWLQAESKAEIGRRLLARAARKPLSARELWALGRLGNRTALYGSLDRLIPAAEAANWLQTLLTMQLPATENLGYCLVLVAQYTGDRARDVAQPLRDRVAHALGQLPNAERLLEWLSDPERHLERAEEAWMLGESLPSGLQLSAPTATD